MATTEDTTEMFIEQVREHPILYDLKNPGYKNLRKKDKIWDSIGPMFGMSGDAAKKKWKNLRDTYAKYLKSIKTTTGQAAKKNYGHWQWAEQMIFLKPYLAFAKSIDNINVSSEVIAVDNNEAELESEIQTSESYAETLNEQNTSVSNTPPAAKPSCEYGNSRTPKNKNKITPVNEVRYFESKLHKRSQTQMDDLERIFLGYAKSVKKLSLRRQAIIKMKLAQIIAEQELSEIDENKSVISPYDSSSTPNFSDYGNYSNTSSTTSVNILQPTNNNKNNIQMNLSKTTATPILSDHIDFDNNSQASSANLEDQLLLRNINEELDSSSSAVAEFYKNFSSL